MLCNPVILRQLISRLLYLFWQFPSGFTENLKITDDGVLSFSVLCESLFVLVPKYV